MHVDSNRSQSTHRILRCPYGHALIKRSKSMTHVGATMSTTSTSICAHFPQLQGLLKLHVRLPFHHEGRWSIFHEFWIFQTPQVLFSHYGTVLHTSNSLFVKAPPELVQQNTIFLHSEHFTGCAEDAHNYLPKYLRESIHIQMQHLFRERNISILISLIIRFSSFRQSILSPVWTRAETTRVNRERPYPPIRILTSRRPLKISSSPSGRNLPLSLGNILSIWPLISESYSALNYGDYNMILDEIQVHLPVERREWSRQTGWWWQAQPSECKLRRWRRIVTTSDVGSWPFQKWMRKWRRLEMAWPRGRVGNVAASHLWGRGRGGESGEKTGEKTCKGRWVMMGPK